MMTEMLNEETVAGGIDGALGTGFVDGIGQVFSASPKAHMYMEGGFVGGITLADVNPNVKPGESIDFYPFVKIDEAQGEPSSAAATSALRSSTIRTSRSWSSTWRRLKRVRSGSRRVRSSRRTRASESAYPNELVKKEADQVKNAETFVFDGSDLCPAPWARTGARCSRP